MRRYLGISVLGWLGATFTGVLFFFITLWLTEIPSATGLASLMEAPVSDEASLALAIGNAGLRTSNFIRGNVDNASRLDSGRVRVTGWAVDISGSKGPLTVIVFTGSAGKAFARKTAGARSDVTESMKLSLTNSQNVAFDLLIACSPGESLLAGAVESDVAFGRLMFGRQSNGTCP